jgi:RNA polymerase sigma-70 factor (ECF subfamily)
MTRTSFSTIIDSNYAYLYHFARRLTGNYNDAQDLVQNTSLKAFTNCHKLDSPRNFKPWVTTILYNIFVSEYHKTRRRQELLSINGSSDAFFYNRSSTTNSGYALLKKEDLLSLTQSTGKKSYRAFALYLDGYSYQEIAKSLGIAVGTVKSRINFVRTKMRDQFSHLNIKG